MLLVCGTLNAERTASVISLRGRWADTGGRIDPRDLPEDADKGAATPGWGCLDPYDSPIAGQVKGKLCKSFGSCPNCPLGLLDTTSPYACAQAHRLLHSLRSAQESILPQVWLSRVGKIHDALLNKWLPMFSVELHEKAKEYDLPPLPIIE